MTERRTLLAWLSSLGLPQARAQTRPPAAWTLATGYSADAFHGQNLQQLGRELAAQGLPLSIAANNSQVALADIPAAVQSGRLQMGEVIMTHLSATLPIAGADAVPFIVHGYDDALRLWQCQRPLIEQAFADRGWLPLMAVPWPPQGLYTTRPIAQPSDLRGSKMRTYNSTTRRIAQMLGATPVELAMAQVAQAWSQGSIDSMITSTVTGLENQVWSRMGYYYDINAWLPKNITFANRAAYQQLSPALQDSLRQAAQSAERRGWAWSESAGRAALAELQRRGLKVEPLSAAFLTELKRLGERFSLDWLRDVGPQANQIFIPYYLKA